MPENNNAVSAATLHQSSFETRRDAPGSQRQAAKEWTARRRSPIEKHFQKHNNDKYFIVMCFAMFTCLPHTHTHSNEVRSSTCRSHATPCCPVAESANRPRRFYNCLNSMYSHYFSRVWRMLLPASCIAAFSQCMKLNLQSQLRRFSRCCARLRATLNRLPGIFGIWGGNLFVSRRSERAAFPFFLLFHSASLFLFFLFLFLFCFSVSLFSVSCWMLFILGIFLWQLL